MKEQIGSKKDQLFTFRLMLVEYRAMLATWRYKGALIPSEELRINALDKLKNTSDQSQLEARNFDVNAVSLGGDALQERMPELDTFEKYFTFCHQSLLNQIAYEMSKYGLSIKQCPGFLQRLDRRIRQLASNTNLIGSSLTNGVLTLMYNYPQRNHSAQVKVQYNMKKETGSIELIMFGDSVRHGDRWYKCVDLLKILSVHFDVPYSSTVSNDAFQFQWKLSLELWEKETIVEGLIKSMKTASRYALDSSLDFSLSLFELEGLSISKDHLINIIEKLLEANCCPWGTIDLIFRGSSDRKRIIKTFLNHCDNMPASDFVVHDIVKFFEYFFDGCLSRGDDEKIENDQEAIAVIRRLVGKLIDTQHNENAYILQQKGYALFNLLYEKGHTFSYQDLIDLKFFEVFPWVRTVPKGIISVFGFQPPEYLQPFFRKLKDDSVGNSDIEMMLKNGVKTVCTQYFDESADDLLDFFDHVTTFIGNKKDCSSISFSHAHPALKKIDLSYSSVQSISGLEQCPNLEELIFEDAEQLNQWVLTGRFEYLKKITLPKELLGSLQFTKDNFPNLEELKLNSPSDNCVMKCLKDFRHLKKLNIDDATIESLDLSGDDLPELEELGLYSLDKLKTLNFSGRFKNLKKITISSAQMLSLLELSGDNLPELEELHLICLDKLKKLKFTGQFHALKELNRFMVHALESLELSENSLRVIDLISDKNLKDLKFTGKFEYLQRIRLSYPYSRSSARKLSLSRENFPRLVLEVHEKMIEIIERKKTWITN